MTPPRVTRYKRSSLDVTEAMHDSLWVKADEHDALVTYWRDRAVEMASKLEKFDPNDEQAHAILDTEG